MSLGVPCNLRPTYGRGRVLREGLLSKIPLEAGWSWTPGDELRERDRRVSCKFVDADSGFFWAHTSSVHAKDLGSVASLRTFFRRGRTGDTHFDKKSEHARTRCRDGEVAYPNTFRLHYLGGIRSCCQCWGSSFVNRWRWYEWKTCETSITTDSPRFLDTIRDASVRINHFCEAVASYRACKRGVMSTFCPDWMIGIDTNATLFGFCPSCAFVAFRLG